MFRRQPPENFYARSKRKLIGWNMQPYEADELRFGFRLDCPDSPTAFGDQRFTTIGYRVTFSATQWSGKEFHHTCISVEGGEWFTVGVAPLPQAQASSLKFDDRHVTRDFSFLLQTTAC
jgi:hypothetical protein